MSWPRPGDDALAEATRPRSCQDCGRLFIGSAAFTVHKDPAAGCLPGDAYGQLAEVDGAWCLRGSDTGR